LRLLSKNILREIVPPTLAGLAAYTFLLLLRSLLQLSEMLVRRGIGLALVARLVILTLPQILVLTLPMAFLFGVLIGMGRLSGDAEVIAMRASGVSKWAIFRPVAGLALALSGIVAVLSLWGYPAANDRLERIENQVFESAALDIAKPRVFSSVHAGWDWTLYFDRESPSGIGWNGVFLDDRSDPQEDRVIVAREGRFRQAGDQLWLDLTDAIEHSLRRDSPRTYRENRNDSVSLLVHQRASPVASLTEKGLREQTIGELLVSLRRSAGSSPSRNRLIEVEIHKKFAIPLACLVFALAAVPLGVRNRRGGKGSGFAISIGIILFYYLLLNNGENWAEQGFLSPALSMWLPNLVLGAAALALFLGREEERRGIVSRLLFWKPAGPSRSARGEASGNAAVSVAILPYNFLGRIDRYILRPFLGALAGIYTTVAFLYLIVDYSDHAEDILKRHIPAPVVMAYYRSLLVPIAVTILPFCILLAALLALGTLSRNNEETAFKACGVSLRRLGLPIVAVSLLAACGAYAAGEYLLPEANRRNHALLDQIKGRPPRPSSSFAGTGWILGSSGNRIWSFESADSAKGSLWQPTVFEFDPDFRIVRRISANSAEWREGRWVFRRGWIRTFGGTAETSFQEFENSAPVEGDPPRLFSHVRQRPDEMRFRALSRYVAKLRKTGYPVAALATGLFAKPAAAAQSVVLALLAIPFAFTIGKRGALTGVGIGLAAGMFFLILAAFFTKLGEVGSLPPLLAAWSPNLLFAIFAGYRLTRLRT
jgi:LPS export ABC transporter permease LptF/LPS export ABC transporter permease LptG